jgi:hypothetical protein
MPPCFLHALLNLRPEKHSFKSFKNTNVFSAGRSVLVVNPRKAPMTGVMHGFPDRSLGNMNVCSGSAQISKV